MINKCYEGNEVHDTQVADNLWNSSLILTWSQRGRKGPPHYPTGLHLSSCRQAFHTQYCAQAGTQDWTMRESRLGTQVHHYCFIPNSSFEDSCHGVFLPPGGRSKQGNARLQALVYLDRLTSLKTRPSLERYPPYQSPWKKAIVSLSMLVCRGQGQSQGLSHVLDLFPFS